MGNYKFTLLERGAPGGRQNYYTLKRPFYLNEGVERLLLMVLGDDFCQEGIFALGQLDEGADAVNVGVDLNVEDVVFS